MAETIHTLKVTLRKAKPPVWRRIEVNSTLTMGELAAVLEAAMGWWGTHLHRFEVGGTRYGMPDRDWPAGDLDENRSRLADVLPEVGVTMGWDYDFGDGWSHEVLVEAIDASRRGAEYPVCLDGSQACPPEDCGGPWGYARLLEALADPDHPEHDDLTEWVPPGFDPADFDIEGTTRSMRSPRPAQGWI